MPGKSYKPKSVKAEQLTFDGTKKEGTKGRTNAEELAEWSGGTVNTLQRNAAPQVVLTGRTGTKVANVDDYVVELSENNFTTMSKAEFERTYE